MLSSWIEEQREDCDGAFRGRGRLRPEHEEILDRAKKISKASDHTYGGL
jgi:hypothetical protein